MAAEEGDAKREKPNSDPLVGAVLNGRFHVIRRIARGGMGSVYFATQAPLSRPVAIKVLHGVPTTDTDSEDNFRRRFLREASILAKLQHPNIVMLFDYGQITNLPGEHYFMAMEYLRGETLAERFRVHGRLSIVDSLRLARQVGRGLREAHRCGVVHRDLKPSNIMLVPDDDEKGDIVKLVDFGIGKIMPGRADHAPDNTDVTRAGLVLGSPRYMSPEQIRSEPVDPRTDVYGLGVILFQALTGRVPFDGGSNFDVMVSHCLVAPPELTEACPTETYPEPLSRLVSALLQKKAANRPTMEEFLRRLTALEHEIYGTSLMGATSQSFAPLALRRTDPPPDLAESQRRPSLPALGLSAQTVPSVELTGASPTLPQQVSWRASWRTPTVRSPRATRAIAWSAIVIACLLVGRCVFRSTGSSRVGDSARPKASAPLISGSVASPAAAPAPGSFALTIDSNPPEATVSEDGKSLGTTPLTLTIDRGSVASRPRRFALESDGYAPYTLEQGDSETAVHLSAVLARPHPRAPGRSVPPARSTAGLGPPVSPVDTFGAKRDESSGLDIRLRR